MNKKKKLFSDLRVGVGGGAGFVCLRQACVLPAWWYFVCFVANGGSCPLSAALVEVPQPLFVPPEAPFVCRSAGIASLKRITSCYDIKLEAQLSSRHDDGALRRSVETSLSAFIRRSGSFRPLGGSAGSDGARRDV